MRAFKLTVLFLLLPIMVLGIAGILYKIIYFGGLLYTASQTIGHQEFAAKSVSQIAPARQMDDLFPDCRHYITYASGTQPLFNSVAYFGERYELTMQVPVEIDSPTSGRTIGEPQFWLHEVQTVTVSPSGQLGAKFSRQFEFGEAEWQQLRRADGDFQSIGFTVNPTPVTNFAKYAAAGRPSN